LFSTQYITHVSFVVPPRTLTDLTPNLRGPPPYKTPKLETGVIVGIFPTSIAHVRPGNVNDDGALAAAFEDAIREAQAGHMNGNGDQEPMQPMRELAEVREEDEEKPNGDAVELSIPEVIDVTSSPKLLPTDAPKRPKRPKSLNLDNKQAHPTKPQPPVPIITAGDSTIAGQAWPLVDEIACAIREWHEVCLCG
jgi:dedicator of cytokinesis protein 3